ncbi:nuclear transport factor 2 family protein [Streptomyces avidinii]
MTRTGISAALTDLLLSRDLTVEEAADRHFAPEYRQRTDGEWADRAGFIEHITHLRGVVDHGSVQVHEELYDGSKYARRRHPSTSTKTDASTVSMEVYLFGEFAADGRFSRIEETTLMLRGSAADRDLGSAR